MMRMNMEEFEVSAEQWWAFLNVWWTGRCF